MKELALGSRGLSGDLCLACAGEAAALATVQCDGKALRNAVEAVMAIPPHRAVTERPGAAMLLRSAVEEQAVVVLAAARRARASCCSTVRREVTQGAARERDFATLPRSGPTRCRSREISTYRCVCFFEAVAVISFF